MSDWWRVDWLVLDIDYDQWRDLTVDYSSWYWLLWVMTGRDYSLFIAANWWRRLISIIVVILISLIDFDLVSAIIRYYSDDYWPFNVWPIHYDTILFYYSIVQPYWHYSVLFVYSMTLTDWYCAVLLLIFEVLLYSYCYCYWWPLMTIHDYCIAIVVI